MNTPSVRQIPTAAWRLIILGLVVLVASWALTKTGRSAASALK